MIHPYKHSIKTGANVDHFITFSKQIDIMLVKLTFAGAYMSKLRTPTDDAYTSKLDQNRSNAVQDDVKTIKGKAMADRFYISQLGEPYYDMLKVEAWLKQRTMSAEANSILCSRLMQREDYRNRLIRELARKRGISFEKMWDDILTGEADVMSPEEYKNLRESDEE